MTPIIPRVSEAIDTDLIRQKRGGTITEILDLDAECLAIVALGAAAEFLKSKGEAHAARTLLSHLER